ncbi:MAG: formate--tetrahydrofolate ligase [Bacilli bacterium]|nr:formate--tetrahydrofolate ligase [Bacilli bacterium]MBN2877734.1 formate--tetrahydrofolate ligase [Bacilli bacterium]
MLSDLEIAQKSKMIKINEIAKKLNLSTDEIEMYGNFKAKISYEALEKVKQNKRGKIILVSAINPTPAGEGKSTTTIGLGDSLNKLGYQTMICLREPSLGPVMGVKGGATGGGYSQVVPMEDINLHFTGDIHAISAANNLISAVIDNHLYQGNELNINPEKVIWRRAMDMNDRALRKIQVAISLKKEVPRFDGFDITVASEVMAVFCLANNLDELKERIDRIVVAYNIDDHPITVKDLKVGGAVVMLLKDAFKPNLVQTLEGNPVLIHGGPFANIAHGCNSIMATDYASKISEYTVTEAGFGADLGMEKFMDIKMRAMDSMPELVVLVASIRALKLHGEVEKDDLKEENVEALALGVKNLEKHIESVKEFHLPYVIALNKFPTDTDKEVDFMETWATTNNHPFSLSRVFELGSEGGLDLAQKVVNAIKEKETNNFSFLYPLNLSIEEKLNNIAKRIYGANEVVFSDKAKEQIETYKKLGWDKLAICVAKTPLSLTDDAKIKGRPTDFSVTVREFKPSVGAGFIVALMGNVMTMPGLPKEGAYMNMDVIDGKIVGLF